MGFDFDGYVLRPPRVATGNAQSTGEATSGVDRDHKTLSGYTSGLEPTGRPPEPFADAYRAAVLLRTDAGAEYLLWAANNGSLTTVETPDYAIEGDTNYVSAISGTLTVTHTLPPPPTTYTDGTDSFTVKDAGGRSIYTVTSLVLTRGDTDTTVTAVLASQDMTTGKVVLDAATLTLLGGGFSPDRGDSITSVEYVLARVRYWWTRNDASLDRFGWDGAGGRWAPLKGQPVLNLGPLVADTVYTLGPKPTRFAVGDYLPGNPSNPDEYALVRVGMTPDSTAIVPLIEVVSDTDAATAPYPFSGPSPDAVVGVTNGKMQFNPAFLAFSAGQTVWYNAETYVTGSSGKLGPLTTANTDPLFLSPIPGPTERPFVRLGFRTHLTPVPCDTDADLPAPSGLTSGYFAWSRTTGKMVFSQDDVDRATPGATGYELAYLKTEVYFDGVALNTQPLPTKAPVQLVDDTGTPTTVPLVGGMYVPLAEPVPFPGISGVRYTPNGSGMTPDLLGGNPTTRVNGDDTGLTRTIEGIGDTFIFTPTRAMETLEVVEYDVGLTNLAFTMSKTLAQVSRQAVTGTLSRAQFKRAGMVGEKVYFLQADVTPATYADEARVYSRLVEPFTLTATDTMRFAIDGVVVTWVSSLTGDTLTAASVAADLQAAITAAGSTGTATVVRGRIVISSANLTGGMVEVGWNADPDDLTGQAALGFLPGWKVDLSDSTYRWLPDNGASFGVYRSPVNLDGTGTASDFCSTGRFDRKIVTESLPGTPTFYTNLPPLLDIPGFAPDVHYASTAFLNIEYLRNYDQLLYEFDLSRFSWLETYSSGTLSVPSPTALIALGHTAVVPETLDPDAMLDTDYGLQLRLPGGVYTPLVNGTDFLFPDNGGAGQVALSTPVSPEVGQGNAGFFSEGSVEFSDLNVSDWSLTLGTLTPEGYRLSIRNGDALGSYVVAGIDPGDPSILLLMPDVPFPASAGPADSLPYASWEVFSGYSDAVYDPSIVADVQAVPFAYLSDEVFRLLLLSSLGTVTSGGTGLFTAYLADALASDREVSLRFGVGHTDPTATLTYIQQGFTVGVIAPTGLVLPTTNAHFATGAFRVRIGGTVYEGASLVGVSSFPPSPILGDIVYYGTSLINEGQLRFGTTTLLLNSGCVVVYDEVLSDTTDLAAGAAEANPSTGEVVISSADATAYAGSTLYLVEQTVLGTDVQVSPIVGGVFFKTPLREGQVVEARYYQANTDGTVAVDDAGVPVPIVEYLSNVIRLEVATAVSTTEYSFNPTGKTVDTAFATSVWVGPNLQNYGGRSDVSVSGNTLTFTAAVDPAKRVRLNYAVLEAFGGEQTYSTSVTPVYRPPFYLEAGQDTFTVEGDRTSEFAVGTLFTVGGIPFYTKATSYDGTTGQTSVTIWPTPTNEVGSRAPANDASTSLSSVPVALIVDPEDPVTGGGNTGFLLSFPSAVYVPVNRGEAVFTFAGDYTKVALRGHLLEVGGYPFIIVGSELVIEGRYTRVYVNNPAPTGLSLLDGEFVYLSSRPVYPNTPVQFTFKPWLPYETVEVVLYGETDENGPLPGRTLVDGVDFTANPATGTLTLKAPSTPSLLPTQRLVMSYYAANIIGPQVQDGAVVVPTYSAQMKVRTAPSTENGYLGRTLVASYTFAAPDSFYMQVAPLEQYLGDVAQIALGRVQAQAVSGGPSLFSPGSTTLSKQGAFGLRGQVQDARDQDRAARVFLSLYNEVIVDFEQVLENIDGRIIGDRDGKFKFFVGRGLLYSPPGYEDPFTGDLNTRLVWSGVFSAYNPDDLLVTTADPLVDPATGTSTNPNKPGAVDGKTPDPATLSFYVEKQRLRVLNDMDDVVLVGFNRPGWATLSAALLPFIDMKGRYLSMWEPHLFSRLFPERTKAFTTTLPGLEANLDLGYTGFYTFARFGNVPGDEPGTTKKALVSTLNTTTAIISNPALGVIEGINDSYFRPRGARARIWAYSATGFPELGGPAEPSLIATPLPFAQFPIDPDTGLPDFAQLASGGGDLFDLVSGDPDLSTPGFAVGQTLAYGQPDGDVFTLGDASTTIGSFLGSITPDVTTYANVCVKQVVSGCVLVLGKSDLTIISASDVLVVETGTVFDPAQGDTIYVSAPLRNTDAEGYSDPPTAEELASIGTTLPAYRTYFDLITANKRSEIRDLTLPSWDDPNLGLKEILGQNPPSPLMPIEGDIAFTNTRQQPAQLPALLGQARDDSGDVSIPYLSTTITELNLLGQVANEVRAFFGADTTVGLPVPISAPVAEQQTWKAVYPDEIVGADGSVPVAFSVLPAQDPATLYTSRDLTPVAGSYTNRSAIGDVRPFDLLLVEAAQGAIPVGAQGVLSVGAVTGGVSGSSVEVPRFVTPTTPAQPVKYTVTNAVSQTGLVGGLVTAGGAGLLVTSSVPIPGVVQTVFDFFDFGAVALADGTGSVPGLGGYNRYLGIGGTGNALVIRIYDTDPASATYGALVEAVTISDPTAWGTVSAPTGSALALAPPNVRDTSIIVFTAGNLSSVANSGIKYGVTVTADAYIDGDTFTATGGGLGVNSASGTTTAAVERDRLTFSERMSLATAAPRGTVTPGVFPVGGQSVETTLAVYEITVGTPPVAGCTVNAPDSVNNPSPGTVGTGLPFTFLTRIDPSTLLSYVGTFTPATTPGTEQGTIKVVSWEANGNVPLSGADLSGIKFSAVPSSDAGETSLILEGEGTNYDRFGAPPGISRAWIQDITVVPGGAIENVQPGDIVVADGGPSGTAAVKTGTYLVRHAVPTNGAASDGTAIYNLATGTSVTAGVEGAIDLTFPQVLSTADIFGVQVALTVDTLVPVTESPTGYAFASGGRLYFILKPTVATYDTEPTSPTFNQWVLDPTAVYFADYGSLPTPDPDTGNATFTLTAFFDATNAPIPQATFLAAVTRGTPVSGMLYLPLRRLADALPANNCVGYALDAAGNNTVGGVVTIALGSAVYIDPATPGTPYSVVYTDALGNLLRDLGGPYAPNNLYVNVPTGSDSTAFYAERDRVVYPSGAALNPTGVAAYLDVGHIDWDDVHFGGTVATAGVLSCLLPGDKLVFGDDLVAPTLSGFVALSGVFLEPSFPLPTGDLGQTVPHVVSASYTATTTAEVGVRDYSDYFAVPPAFGETVHFYVRRIRRFHEAQQKIVGNLELLKPVYETRRGLVLSYNATSRAFVADTSTPTYPQATNIGAFTADMVNINPGDLLRLLDSAGVLLEEAEVEAIVNPITLRLKRPGLSTTLSGGETFEVYLRQAPVPHEQSCEQLLALLTDEVVLDRRADYSDPATTGGQATAFNVLSDTDPTVTYYSATVQVQVGDYVVVDPAGTLFVPTEEGMRPVGDRSVSTRLAEYIAGKPDPLDDNRGFYRVATDPAQTVTYLEVDGASRFGGGADDGSDDVVYGGGGAEYAVLPTIHASSIGTPTTPPDVREGQQSLRPTAASVGGSFLARDPLNFDLDKSITPFSYRIIRPSSVFSQDATELILFMRERMLSWIEEISGAYDNNKGGDYWTFQDEDHIKDVGSPTSPADGLGVISNEFLVSLIGLIEFSPFANTSDCLSVLDRRFWVLDTRLDGETPVGIPTPYADLVNGTGRPVLPDLVNDVLDNDDRFRALRFSWVVFRADRVNGSLQALTRARASLPEQLAAQRQLLLLKKGLGS